MNTMPRMNDAEPMTIERENPMLRRQREEK
jgi:hypothetical protein